MRFRFTDRAPFDTAFGLLRPNGLFVFCAAKACNPFGLSRLRSGRIEGAAAGNIRFTIQASSVAITGVWSDGCSSLRGALSIVQAVQRAASGGDSRM